MASRRRGRGVLVNGGNRSSVEKTGYVETRVCQAWKPPFQHVSGGFVGRTVADDVVAGLEGVWIANAVTGSINTHLVVIFTDVSMARSTLDESGV